MFDAEVLASLQSLKQSYLSPRPGDAHKAQFGHILIVGGARGMPGAVCLAGEAALRVGAGLVSIVTCREPLAGVSTHRPELMVWGLQEDSPADQQQFSQLVKQADVLLLGPGTYACAWADYFLTQALAVNKPQLVDAYALDCLKRMNFSESPRVLTPHPGEAARLLSCTTVDVQANRQQAAKALYQKLGGIIVLKGQHTLLHTQQSQQEVWAQCQAGNPGMATAGTGDVLAGMIAGFWGQLLAHEQGSWQAACLGVQLHAESGDRACERQGELAMLASDLIAECISIIK